MLLTLCLDARSLETPVTEIGDVKRRTGNDSLLRCPLPTEVIRGTVRETGPESHAEP